MTTKIIRVHLATGTRITVASRPSAKDAAELVDVLNVHAVGYQFRVEQPTRIEYFGKLQVHMPVKVAS
jgi:hypothetical protein